MSVGPEACDGLFSYIIVLESSPVEVEHGKFVFCHDVRGGIVADASPYVGDSSLEVSRYNRVEISFCVSCNVDGALIVENTSSIHGGVGIGSHVEVVVNAR